MIAENAADPPSYTLPSTATTKSTGAIHSQQLLLRNQSFPARAARPPGRSADHSSGPAESAAAERSF